MAYEHAYYPPIREDPRTLVLFHEMGGNQYSMLSFAQIIAPTAAIVAPLGKRSEAGYPRFFRRFAESVYDRNDIAFCAYELRDFLLQMQQEHGIVPERTTFIGWAHGAKMAWSLLALHPDLATSAILFRPDWTVEDLTEGSLSEHRIFVTAARNDPEQTTARTKKLLDQLYFTGARTTTYWHEGGSEITEDEAKAAAHWLEQQRIIAGASLPEN